jgi:ribonuclease HI
MRRYILSCSRGKSTVLWIANIGILLFFLWTTERAAVVCCFRSLPSSMLRTFFVHQRRCCRTSVRRTIVITTSLPVTKHQPKQQQLQQQSNAAAPAAVVVASAHDKDSTAPLPPLTRTDVRKMKVVQLRSLLEQHGIDTRTIQSSNRTDLVQTLLQTLLTAAEKQKKSVKTAAVQPQKRAQSLVHPEAATKTAARGTVINGSGDVDDTTTNAQYVSESRTASVRLADDINNSTSYVLRIKGLGDKKGNLTGIGIVLRDWTNSRDVWTGSICFPTYRSMYEAEYTALTVSVRYAIQSHWRAQYLKLQLEQSVLCHHLTGAYPVEKVSLRPMYAQVTALLAELGVENFTVESIPSSQNSDCIELAKRAISRKASLFSCDNDSDDPLLQEDPMDENFGSTNVVNHGGLDDCVAEETIRDVIEAEGTYLLRFDGGSRGNPGIAGAGAVIYDTEGKEVWSGSEYLKFGTCNQAEYSALLLGLNTAKEMGIRRIVVQGDSQLVIKQLKGEFRVKNEGLRTFWTKAKVLLNEFEQCQFTHIPREENGKADALANSAMDRRR